MAVVSFAVCCLPQAAFADPGASGSSDWLSHPPHPVAQPAVGDLPF